MNIWSKLRLLMQHHLPPNARVDVRLFINLMRYSYRGRITSRRSAISASKKPRPCIMPSHVQHAAHLSCGIAVAKYRLKLQQ